MDERPLSLTYLEAMYAALQTLHRNLASADASGIMESVHGLSNLLSRPVWEDAAALSREARSARDSLVTRIVEVQHVNQALCEGGLKTLLRFGAVVEKPVAYNSLGRVDRVPVTDVNVSA